MKRILALCLTVVLLLTAIPAASTALSQYGTVTGGWLRLRRAPSFDAYTISSYYTGTQVKILGVSGSWYNVETPDGQTGYMYSSYVSLQGGGGTGNAYVTSANGLSVRLRSGPGTGYRVLTSYPVGTAVNVLQKGTNWSKIQVGSMIGYMMNRFLTTQGGGGGGHTGDYATVWSANGYGVRLRSGPGRGYGIIGVYSVGTQVEVLSHGSVWDYIAIGSRRGYMMNEFLHYYSVNVVTAVTLNSYTPVVGRKIKVSGTTPTDATVSYEWLRDGSVISGANDVSYTVTDSDLGCKLQARVKGTGKFSGKVTSRETSKVVEGTDIVSFTLNNDAPVVGDVLAVASVDPSKAQFKCQWTVDGRTYTDSTYTVTKDDVGYPIKLKISGTGIYTGSAKLTTSNVTSKGSIGDVTMRNQTNPTKGTITPNVGDKLYFEVTPATATYSFKWEYVENATGKVLETATTESITVKAGDNNAYIGNCSIQLTVKGTGKYKDGVTFTPTTNLIVKKKLLEGVTLDNVTPKYDPDAVAAITVKTVNGSATNITDPGLIYTWTVDGNPVGTNDPSLTLDETLVGKAIKLTVSSDGTIGSFIGSTKTSTKTVTGKIKSFKVVDAYDTEVTAPKVGDVLAIRYEPAYSTTTITADITWMRGSTKVGTGNTYKVTDADAASGKRISVTVKPNGVYYTDASYVNTVSLDPTAKTLLGKPTISPATVKAGEVLTAATDPADAKNAVTYQWYRGTNAISGATGSSYKTVAADINEEISVKEAAKTDSGYADGADMSSDKVVVAAQTFTAKLTSTTSTLLKDTKLTLSTTPSSATYSFAWFAGTDVNDSSTWVKRENTVDKVYVVSQSDVDNNYYIICALTGTGLNTCPTFNVSSATHAALTSAGDSSTESIIGTDENGNPIYGQSETTVPTAEPTVEPTDVPTGDEPTNAPTDEPTGGEPTEAPATDTPAGDPTEAPATDAPADDPTEAPSTDAPADDPTEAPATDAPVDPEPEQPEYDYSSVRLTLQYDESNRKLSAIVTPSEIPVAYSWSYDGILRQTTEPYYVLQDGEDSQKIVVTITYGDGMWLTAQLPRTNPLVLDDAGLLDDTHEDSPVIEDPMDVTPTGDEPSGDVLYTDDFETNTDW